MSDCSTDFLPNDMIYYTATKISRRGQTRFDIDTHLFNPIINSYIQLQLPIESILLYDYLTPIADDYPKKKLFSHTLKSVNFTTFKTISRSILFSPVSFTCCTFCRKLFNRYFSRHGGS